MSTRLTQVEFDTAAAAWATFIDKAAPADVQALFQATGSQGAQYQTFASFDLADTIPLLLSTVGISQVVARFVLAPPAAADGPTPRFRVVLYATDQLGGRISAYYQGHTDYHAIPPKPTSVADLEGDKNLETTNLQSLVPFSLIKNWLTAWVTAATTQQLSAALFTTHYGPLQGYNFELGDFMDQLFSAAERKATQLYLNFGLKTYYPAYPEAPAKPTQTFGLVVRLYSPGSKGTDDTGSSDGTESGPSYDLGKPYPPS